MRFYVLPLSIVMLGGCASINECGISTYYYSDCVEGYDAQGIYFKKCPHVNIYNKCEKKEDIDIKDCLNCN
jgi:hypothetical protein